VNLGDFNILAGNFGQSPRTFSQADFNYDGTVNLADFNILAARFGQTLPPASAAANSLFSGRSIRGEIDDYGAAGVLPT
jgi:hypothetical protein